MKKTLLFLLLAGTTGTAWAQKPASTIGISLAYARTELISSTKAYEAVGHSAYQAGITGDIYVSQALSVHPELLYTMQYYDTNTDDQNRDLTYLNLPVLLRYHIASNGSGSLFFEAGPQLNLPLTVKNEDGDDVKSQTNSVSLDYVVGLGYQLGSGFSLGVRYDGGATNIFKNYDTSNPNDAIISTGNLKTSTILFVLGYAFGGH